MKAEKRIIGRKDIVSFPSFGLIHVLHWRENDISRISSKIG